MVHTADACAECTQNCLLMHKKDKNPSSVATTFFKVMFGDDYSKIMYLPPKFARTVQNMVGTETQLEDSIGEKWTVKLKRVDGLLAFEEGWNKFSLDHGIKLGDFLVFHYISGSHFVVLMFGHSGCPEIRHFGFTRHQAKNTGKKGKFIADDPSPSNVNTNGHFCSNKSSSSQSEPSETRKKKRIRTNDNTSPPNVNTINAPSVLSPPNVNTINAPSVSNKETGQRSECLVKNTTPDKVVPETPKTVEPFCLVDRYTGNVEDEYRRSCFIDLSIFETCRNGSDGGRKNGVLARGGEDETPINESGKVVETQIEEMAEKAPERVEKPPERADKPPERAEKPPERAEKPPERAEKPPERAEKLPERAEKLPERAQKWKERAVVKSEAATCHTSIKTRLRNASAPTQKTEKDKRARVGSNDRNNTVEATRVTRANAVKKEPVSVSDTDNSGSRLRNGGSTSAFRGIFQKPMAKSLGAVKKEPTVAHGSDGAIGISSGYGSKKDAKTGCRNPVKKENDHLLLMVKPEPVDYEESPLPGSGNTTFSAVMSTYKYLELPKSVKLQSKVILLRNGGDFWPVLCRSELGLKALTYCWEAFARAKGIQPGDECEFVLEKEPDGSLTCSVFRVDVTRK